MGLIGPRELENIEQGKQQNYLAHGSVEDQAMVRHLKNYHLLFRMLPLTPAPVMEFILKHRLHKFLRIFAQTPVIIVIDVLVSIVKRDYYSLWAIRTYLFEMKRRMKARIFGPVEFVYKSSHVAEVEGEGAREAVASRPLVGGATLNVRSRTA
jgi:hypothetical protein